MCRRRLWTPGGMLKVVVFMSAPKYLQIENQLRAEIEHGDFEPGERFYSNTDLIERFGASSITVIRALNDLAAEGLLVRHQGRGTFVSRSRRRRPVLISEVEKFDGEGTREKTEVLGLEFFEDDRREPVIVDRLQLTGDAGYGLVTRLRSWEGVSYQLQLSYIPARFLKRDVDPSYYESVYYRFAEDFGLHLSREASEERVRGLLDPPAFVSERLGLPSGVPCIQRERTTSLMDGSVAEYIVMYKRLDYFELKIEEQAR